MGTQDRAVTDTVVLRAVEGLHGRTRALHAEGRVAARFYAGAGIETESGSFIAFLKNHAKDLIAVDFFTVPTATFRILFVLVVLSHARRRLVHFNVTEHPTAGWTARQLVEAYGLEETPGHLIRDRDQVYGERFSRQARMTLRRFRGSGADNVAKQSP